MLLIIKKLQKNPSTTTTGYHACQPHSHILFNSHQLFVINLPNSFFHPAIVLQMVPWIKCKNKGWRMPSELQELGKSNPVSLCYWTTCNLWQLRMKSEKLLVAITVCSTLTHDFCSETSTSYCFITHCGIPVVLLDSTDFTCYLLLFQLSKNDGERSAEEKRGELFRLWRSILLTVRIKGFVSRSSQPLSNCHQLFLKIKDCVCTCCDINSFSFCSLFVSQGTFILHLDRAKCVLFGGSPKTYKGTKLNKIRSRTRSTLTRLFGK